MKKTCRKRGDQAGLAFWSHALNLTEILGDHGQSDEEDATIEVEIEGVMMKQSVKKVSRLYWREPGIEECYKIVDCAPGVEAAIFHRAGAPRMQRIRTDKVSHRLPPAGLPRSVFRPEYLSALLPFEFAELKLADYTFQMYDFKGYNANAESGDDRNAMDIN
ncbi:hypothetical protein F5879DRAFT_810933 [Lentinula edodes]|uniref:Uncharacterized protein n=1 Tax=Lentinula aff. lateritia TaxID=2804960 RepID=A0ACC1TP73_9AGAR|nr:uncharacterized protein C8R40DRAFT_1038479 [Lentinula edodes]KAJ3806473.1 hypothetical protein F5876DRAFT_49985 [Lentinula aff. lateritia]KAJ3847692.1 hypothetical protein EV368DRAFT_50725 [Lentinula lateritia]KAH7878360.1 hypothetical protein C8R40DRAFT_1038479 [Lentinula edodes]KAJ3899413.1 hypothetical protein F5879DRAFT_810933 [Lentinula edodes]KAJ3913326.1 hypothetical protein F5877DRAFT_52571 [Lentinula edodes]